MKELKSWVKKSKNLGQEYFIGRIAVYCNKEYLYSHSTGQPRKSENEALKDANILKSSLIIN